MKKLLPSVACLLLGATSLHGAGFNANEWTAPTSPGTFSTSDSSATLSVSAPGQLTTVSWNGPKIENTSFTVSFNLSSFNKEGEVNFFFYLDEAKTIGAMFRTINEMDGVPEIGGMGGADGLFVHVGSYAPSFFINGTVPGEIGPPSFGSAYSGGSISLEFVYNDGKWTCSYDGTTSEAKEIVVKPEMGMGVVSGFMGGMDDGGSVKLTEFSAVTSGAAVPEPSTCSVLMAALLFGALRRRR